MIKGFKDFLMRGNVVDLAVAVVIGAAFSSIVKGFTDNIINPLIASIGSGPKVQGLAWQIRGDLPATIVDFGALITAVVNFLIVAAVVYFVFVLPMNHFKERQEAKKAVGEPEETPTPEDVALLREIRDLLAAQRTLPRA